MNTLETFDNLIQGDNLLRGIYSYGFENPSPIQTKSIPIITNGKDIIAQAQSGTGKTGSFSIGILNTIDGKLNEVQKLVVVPTHELALQINDVMNNLSKYMNINIITLIGKTSINDSIEKLSSNPHIVIGTPGRILDMIQRKYLFTNKINTLIFDEADEILSSGFIETIYNIIRYCSNNTQICLFSATIPNDILELSTKFMNNPEKILINKERLTLEGINQYYINVDQYNWKFDTIMDLYEKININQCIIYLNTKSSLHRLYNLLNVNKFPVSYITSELSSTERKNTLDEFKSGKSRVLLSTDLLSRGIDIQQLSLVINFDIPHDKETYIHRIGRSGRYGRKGSSINLISTNERDKLEDLIQYYNTEINELPANFEHIF
ncbi:MAG: ATP-dependent RNA helicase [Candidatus Marinimicrobia bacterium]|nr:ATP-dependent RNA helicase [Candidatus Neomarinimicrobiota bacterium]